MRRTTIKRVCAYTVSVTALSFLCAPTTIKGILGSLLLFVILFITICFTRGSRLGEREKQGFSTKVLIAAIVVMLQFSFYRRWIPSKRVEAISRRVHITDKQFVVLITIVLGVLAVFSLSGLVIVGHELIKRFNAERAFAFLATLFLEFYLLEFSSLETLNLSFHGGLLFLFLNFFLLAALNSFLAFLLGSWRAALIISVVTDLIWSVANYYTIKFHGSPLFFSELINVKTAAAVLPNLRISLTISVIAMVFLSFAMILIVWNTYRDHVLDDFVKKRITNNSLKIQFLNVK